VTDKEKKMVKELKFRELAQTRVNKAIKAIELIGNLSNKNNYSYTDEEVKKIFAAIQKSLSQSKARFNVKNGKNGFNL
tara:strand:- start:4900 stop:5133 length:234 start_codon:yes stop_codon:yes gene_type:complete